MLGVAVTVVTILGLLKQFASVKLLKLFSSDLGLWNEFALVVLGLILSLLLTTAWQVRDAAKLVTASHEAHSQTQRR